jgi:hypothetical protein
MNDQVTLLDRAIVAAVALLIAAFALATVSAFVPGAQADDQLVGTRDDDSGEVVTEDDDDDDDDIDDPTGTTQGTGPSATATNDTATGTHTVVPAGGDGNTATGTTQGTGPSNTATNDTNTGTVTANGTATGTTQGTGPSNTATNDTNTGTRTQQV